MGRELKRVPLDFDQPLNEVWKGFLNPLYVAKQCPDCEGSGGSEHANILKNKWYGYVPFNPEERGSKPFAVDNPYIRSLAHRNCREDDDGERVSSIVAREVSRLCSHFNGQWCHHLGSQDVAALVEAGRLMDLTHTWTKDGGWTAKEPAYLPTPEEVNNWSIDGFGHDSINQWVCVKAECKINGWPEECSTCKGEGEIWPSEEAKKAYDEWEQYEPPEGEGYQIWETVSEGSPISPVFATPEELAGYMTTTRWGADKGTPYNTWLKFINGPGWAPSMIGTSQGIQSGVAAVSVNCT